MVMLVLTRYRAWLAIALLSLLVSLPGCLRQRRPRGDLSTFALEEVERRRVEAVGIFDPSRYDPQSIAQLWAALEPKGIPLLVQVVYDPRAGRRQRMQLAAKVNEWARQGIITVAATDWEGLVILKDAPLFDIDIYASGGGWPGVGEERALGCVLGSLSLLMEKLGTAAGTDWKQLLRERAIHTWMNSDLDTRQWTRKKFTIDAETLTYVNEGGYAFRLLDVPSLLELQPPVSLAHQLLRIPEAQEMATGRGVRVAIIDFGFWLDVPWLQGRIENAAAFGRTPLNQSAGFHGTRMASILLEIAPDATVIPVLISEETGRPDFLASIRQNIVRGLEHAAANGADIVSLSMKLVIYDQKIKDKIMELANRGILVVAVNLDLEHPGVIVTEFIYDRYRRYHYQTWGIRPDLWASERFICPRYPIELWAGNSNVPPQIAGIAALMLEKQPHARPAQLKLALVETAHQLPGNRRLPDVVAALQRLAGDDPGDTSKR